MATILARWQRPVASKIALDPLCRSIYVHAHRQGQWNGWQVWYFFVVVFCHLTLLSVPGNTVQILARWRHPVASRDALNPLYWLILAVTCWRIISSVKTARTEVHSFAVDDFAIELNLYQHSNTLFILEPKCRHINYSIWLIYSYNFVAHRWQWMPFFRPPSLLVGDRLYLIKRGQ